MKKLATVMLIGLTLCACNIRNPTTIVRPVDDRPSLCLSGAPEKASLFVDGLDLGLASDYDGRPKVVRLEPGTHLIEIKSGAETIFKQTVFIESGIREIKVH